MRIEMFMHATGHSQLDHGTSPDGTRPNTCGVSLVELMMVLVVVIIIAAIAVPMFNSVKSDSDMNSMESAITGAIAQTRYAAIMNSQPYTMAISVPANTYTVTNVSTGTSTPAVPLPGTNITLNGGTAGTFTYTLCPNGIVYGAGDACPGTTTPPSITAQNTTREVTLSVSSVGNVSTTTIH